MSITNFIPELYTDSVLVALKKLLVYVNCFNNDYAGMVSAKGDAVRITAFSDIPVNPYTRNSTITYSTLTDEGTALLIDSCDVWAFTVDDLDKKQASSDDFISYTADRAAYSLAIIQDEYAAGKMAAGVSTGGTDVLTGTADGVSNQLGAITVATVDEAYNLILELRNRLTKSLVPAQDRFVVVPTDLYAVLLKDPRFVYQYIAGTTDGLRNGEVGKVLGFTVLESQ